MRSYDLSVFSFFYLLLLIPFRVQAESLLVVGSSSVGSAWLRTMRYLKKATIVTRKPAST